MYMKYILFIALIPLSVYLISFARFNWQKKNRRAAVGIILINLAAVVLPVLAFLLGNYEL